MEERIHWIDLLRGICVLVILLDHTEIYYTGINIIPYNFYVANAITAFFFISGYLFYNGKRLVFRQKLISISRSIIMPYFIFTILMALPKAVANNKIFDIREIFMGIITGQASWFIAALAVSEILFLCILMLTKGNKYVILPIGLISLFISAYLSTGNQPYPWQIDNALQALFFLTVGYIYHKYEKVFNSFNNTSYTILLLSLIILKVYEYKSVANMTVWFINISNYALFTADMLTGIILMSGICKKLPRNRIIEWTGKHALVYYFICGGVPLVISKSLEYLNCDYRGCYLQIIIAFIIVYALATAITWFVYRYIPFITGHTLNKNR
jgi:fucose 4-O-acetylase-like acetyltransferase